MTKCAVSLRSDNAKQAMEDVKRQSLSDSQVEDAMAKLLSQPSGSGANAFSGAIDESIKSSLQDPDVLDEAEKLMGARVDQKGQGYADQIAGRLLKSAVDPKTGKLDAYRLRSVKASLNEVRS
jgi:hypothetical protein